jgi:hypothetical protein
MDINRRNLMKGVLTGGALLALGIPPGTFASAPAGRAGRFGLLLGNTPLDAEFAAGIRTAYAANARYMATESGAATGAGAAGLDAPQVVKLTGGLLNDYERAAGLLEKSRDTRWIAVMDDGSAAIFMELARNAGARLILLGSHASSGDDAFMHGISPGIPELRHVWAAASPMHSAGGILASRLIENQGSFSIVENFLSAEHSSTQMRADSIAASGPNPGSFTYRPGFLAYRLDGPDAIHLHCSGLSPSDGCESLGWNTAGGWTPVSRQVSTHEAGARRGAGQPQSAGWVESVGYAVMAAALGTSALQESCSSRAFVHRPSKDKANGHSGPTGPGERFTSFVIDI